MTDWRTALRGGLIYCGGDSAATLIAGEFLYGRALGLFLTGSLLYAWEIGAYFAWIERRAEQPWLRALLAQAWFNPLWIARHLLLIRVFSGRWQAIDWDLLQIAWSSFWHIVPIGLLMNYLIQNRIALKWRFLASATYSALMAIYLALSEVWFG